MPIETLKGGRRQVVERTVKAEGRETSLTSGAVGVLGAKPLGEGVMEDLPWIPSLRSRMTEGQGCKQGETSPFF